MVASPEAIMDRRMMLAASWDEPVTEVTRTTTKIHPTDNTKTCCTESTREVNTGGASPKKKELRRACNMVPSPAAIMDRRIMLAAREANRWPKSRKPPPKSNPASSQRRVVPKASGT